MASESSDLTAAIELPEFPRRAEFETLEEFQENAEKYYEENGLRPPEDFSEEEKKSIVEECTVELYSPTMLAEKYNVNVTAIRGWIKSAGKTLPQKYKFNATGTGKSSTSGTKPFTPSSTQSMSPSMSPALDPNAPK